MAPRSAATWSPTAGAVAAFAANAVLYIPLLMVLFLWRRVSEPSRLPRERLNRAIVSGVRYIVNSPSIRIVLARTLVTGVIGGSVSALMPLVARDLLHGGAQTYGIMLGAFGMGAVIGALNISEVRKRMHGEAAVRACALSMGGLIAAVALSREPVLTAAALVLAGAAWMLAVALFNIGVQLSAPRWVAGRSLAAFQASIAGGIAVGSWGWGRRPTSPASETALLTSAGLMMLSPLLGLWLRMPRIGARNEDAELLADPEVRLSLTGRSGPLVVEIEYRVDQGNARAFHNVMQDVQLSRQRNGAYGWSVARDIADPELWTERHHCPTWLDICASATARPSPNARFISAPWNSISVPIRSASAACWNGRSARCAGRKNPRPRRQRSIAGGRHRGRQQHTDLTTRLLSQDQVASINPVQHLVAGFAMTNGGPCGRCWQDKGEQAESPSFITARQ